MRVRGIHPPLYCLELFPIRAGTSLWARRVVRFQGKNERTAYECRARKKKRIDRLGSRINFVGRSNLFNFRFDATDPLRLLRPPSFGLCARVPYMQAQCL